MTKGKIVLVPFPFDDMSALRLPTGCASGIEIFFTSER
jgi:hypothetical protein